MNVITKGEIYAIFSRVVSEHNNPLQFAVTPIISLLRNSAFGHRVACEIPGYFPYFHDDTMALLVRWGSTGTCRSANGIYKYVDTIFQPMKVLV